MACRGNETVLERTVLKLTDIYVRAPFIILSTFLSVFIFFFHENTVFQNDANEFLCSDEPLHKMQISLDTISHSPQSRKQSHQRTQLVTEQQSCLHPGNDRGSDGQGRANWRRNPRPTPSCIHSTNMEPPVCARHCSRHWERVCGTAGVGGGNKRLGPGCILSTRGPTPAHMHTRTHMYARAEGQRGGGGGETEREQKLSLQLSLLS